MNTKIETTADDIRAAHEEYEQARAAYERARYEMLHADLYGPAYLAAPEYTALSTDAYNTLFERLFDAASTAWAALGDAETVLIAFGERELVEPIA